ncbi:MAG: chlorite dismutase family protein [Acidimicrobiia bacterium]|nr:chlorite dismutase family protein [Acidimicrobiia bacterium]
MDPVKPNEGLGVLHLFGRVHSPDGAPFDRPALERCVAQARAQDATVVPVAILGHKADLCLMVLHADFSALRRFQSAAVASGVAVVDSYLSLTELSEYSVDVADNERRLRLWPKLPPPNKPAWCFYPMSKRRNVGANWYTLTWEQRRDLMREHGMSGRKFGGRIAQLVTGSTGLDDFEWGVTLWGQAPDDLKAVVYTMRYDEGSALYGEFGRFYTGVTGELAEVLDQLGV